MFYKERDEQSGAPSLERAHSTLPRGLGKPGHGRVRAENHEAPLLRPCRPLASGNRHGEESDHAGHRGRTVTIYKDRVTIQPRFSP